MCHENPPPTRHSTNGPDPVSFLRSSHHFDAWKDLKMNLIYTVCSKRAIKSLTIHKIQAWLCSELYRIKLYPMWPIEPHSYSSHLHPATQETLSLTQLSTWGVGGQHFKQVMLHLVCRTWRGELWPWPCSLHLAPTPTAASIIQPMGLGSKASLVPTADETGSPCVTCNTAA